MLDYFAIFSLSGVIIWDKCFGPSAAASVLNAAVSQSVLQGRDISGAIDVDTFRVRWQIIPQLQLCLTAVLSKAIAAQVPYISDLFTAISRDVAKRYPGRAWHNDPGELDYTIHFQHILHAVEAKHGSAGTAQPAPEPTETTASTPITQPTRDMAESAAAKGAQLAAETPEERTARLAAKRAAARAARTSSARTTPKSSPTSTKGRSQPASVTQPAGRKWSDTPVTAAEAAALDVLGGGSSAAADAPIEAVQYTGGGDIADLLADDLPSAAASSAASRASGWLARSLGTLTGGTMSSADIAVELERLREHLTGKNVAEEVAADICQSVQRSLEGSRRGSFTSVATVVENALREAVARILTPREPVDLLAAVRAKKASGQGPYVITFVGVNGVGKSTSLSKVVYHLRDNGLKVLIAACDTFRSGAVEQLRRHATALDVPLFQRGYEKDSAGVAAAAVRAGAHDGFDVVVVDTAGRMQNNRALMLELAKLVDTITPDLVLFVGEALVGNDGVDQLVEFNRALVQHGQGSATRGIDGIVLTKFDTIDDKVGASLSMVYKSNVPITFVGVGQTYTDLRRLNVAAVVRDLLA